MAIVMCGFSLYAQSQENSEGPLQIELEAFLVESVTSASGEVTERFSLAAEVTPGQIIEYRLNLLHIGEATLPAGVRARGPIPAQTAYLAASASPSSALAILEFSADSGEMYASEPLTRTETDTSGNEITVEIPPSDYTDARWTLQDPLEPGQVLTFIYRVEVQ
ncbi:MAG: hypothetical protein AAF267_02690 [Deinococcota bacterium]